MDTPSQKDIILNNEVVAENNFSFYHHGEDEIIKFAVVPWTLPNSEISSFSKIRKDILKRFQLIEKSFGHQDVEYGFIRQSYPYSIQ